MRKAIFTTLAAGAFILAGCTKTEVTEVSDSRAISFSNHVTNAVKSIDKLEDLKTFYVYGAHTNGQEVFNGDAVSFSNGEWTYNPTRYWNDTKYAYKFAAYTDDNKTVSNPENNVEFTYSSGHLTITDYTVNNTPTDGSDLLYAVGYDGTDYVFDGTDHYEVQLEFKHILSKVTFNFSKAADLNGVEIDVSDITINAFNQGTFTGNTPTSPGSQYALSCWVPSGQKSDIAFDNFSLTGSATEETSKNTQTRVFLPQDLVETTAYNIVFTIKYSNTIKDDGTIDNGQKNQIKVFTCTIAGTDDGNWNPGYSYTYTAEINSTNLEGLYPIEFTVSYDNWDKENVDDIIIDNEQGQGQ
jgi:hypothetical protein